MHAFVEVEEEKEMSPMLEHVTRSMTRCVKQCLLCFSDLFYMLVFLFPAAVAPVWKELIGFKKKKDKRRNERCCSDQLRSLSVPI